VFDISFAELMMIAIVALIVIGPDKLPQVAKTVGAYVGRLQRYVAQVKEEVNREVRFEELTVKDTLNTAARSISEKKANAKPLKSSTSKPSSKSNTNSTTAKKPVKKQKMDKA
jgi:sec-independent protein translocase protein TatB